MEQLTAIKEKNFFLVLFMSGNMPSAFDVKQTLNLYLIQPPQSVLNSVSFILHESSSGV